MNTIALADFSFLLRQQYHARANDSGPNDCGSAALQILSDWRRQFTHLVVCLDRPPYWRKQKYAEYKAQRERDDTYSLLCKWTLGRLELDGYSIAQAESFEADDVIATLALKLANDRTKVVILTGDKDTTQCVRHNVECWAPAGNGFETRDVQWVEKKWGISPDQVPLLLAIMGDTSDNIPGIKGIGEKGASKLINQFKTIPVMRLEAVKAFEQSVKDKKPLSAFWKKFLEGAPKLPEWLELTTLRTDVPLNVDALLVKRDPKPLVEDDMGAEPTAERGDAWEPSAEEMAEEKEMLSPEEAISGPPSNGSNIRESPIARGLDGIRAVVPIAKEENQYTLGAIRPNSGEATLTTASERLGAVDVVETSLATVSVPQAPAWNLALQPRTPKEAWQMAAAVWNSRHMQQYGSVNGVYATILRGRELGYGFMASLEMFHIVKDKPYPKAKALNMLACRDPDCEWLTVVSADDKHATVKTKSRKMGVLEYTYTIERAQKAGYLNGPNKHNWATLTQEMLEARATSKAVNRWYPGATFGMNSAEEMQDREVQQENNDE